MIETKGISSQNKQATGKMGSKVEEKIPNKKCIIAELKPRLNSMEVEVSTLFMWNKSRGRHGCLPFVPIS